MSKKAMGRAARRGYELQQMIEFDVTEYDFFDMPPVTEYTNYMRSFGSSNTKQVSGVGCWRRSDWCPITNKNFYNLPILI